MKLLLLLLIPLSYASMWLIEYRRPALAYEPVVNWARTGLLFFAVSAAVSTVGPAVIAALKVPPVLNLASMGWWGFPIGLLLATGATYAWHRGMHASDTLWRMTHQLHHSPPRVDTLGAFYAHPLEVLVKTTIVSAVLVVLGFEPLVAASVSTTMTMLSLFQHWNVRTPRWLGWFVPRPEMHAFHHEREVHGGNYGDLPLWDVIFGTWHNPETFEGAVGFDRAASVRVKDMLRFRDVGTKT